MSNNFFSSFSIVSRKQKFSQLCSTHSSLCFSLSTSFISSNTKMPLESYFLHHLAVELKNLLGILIADFKRLINYFHDQCNSFFKQA